MNKHARFRMSFLLLLLFVTFSSYLLFKSNFVIADNPKVGCCVTTNGCFITLEKDCGGSNTFYPIDCLSIDTCNRGCCLLYKNNDFLYYPNEDSPYFDKGVTRHYCSEMLHITNADLMVFREGVVGDDCKKEWINAKDFTSGWMRYFSNALNFDDVYCDNYLKREDAARIMARLASLFLIKEETNDNCEFSDVSKEDPYYPFIKKSCEWRIFHGYPDGTFKPNKFITRAEFIAVLINNFYGMVEFTEDEIKEMRSIKFKDVDENHWAFKKLQEAKFLGLLHGYPDGTIRPDNPLSCKEFKILLENVALIKRVKLIMEDAKELGLWDYMFYVFMVGALSNNKELFPEIPSSEIPDFSMFNDKEISELVKEYKFTLLSDTIFSIEEDLREKKGIVWDKRTIATSNPWDRIEEPVGIVTDNKNFVFIADANNGDGVIHRFYYDEKQQRIFREKSFKGAWFNLFGRARIREPISINIDLNNNILYVIDSLNKGGFEKLKTRIVKCSFEGSCRVYKESTVEELSKVEGTTPIGFFNNGNIMLRVDYNEDQDNIIIQYYTIKGGSVRFEEEKIISLDKKIGGLPVVKKIIPVVKLEGNTARKESSYYASLTTDSNGLDGFLVVLEGANKNKRILYYPINKRDIKFLNGIDDIGVYSQRAFVYNKHSYTTINSKEETTIKGRIDGTYLSTLLDLKVLNTKIDRLGTLSGVKIEDFLPLKEDQLLVIEERKDDKGKKEGLYQLSVWVLSEEKKMSEEEKEKMTKEEYKKYGYSSDYGFLWPIKAKPRVYWKFDRRLIGKSNGNNRQAVRSGHQGIDIDDPGDKNDNSNPPEIRAVMDGVVVLKRDGCPNCSKYYKIYHDKGCENINSGNINSIEYPGLPELKELCNTAWNCFDCGTGKRMYDRWGNYVWIDHKVKGKKIRTVYAHLKNVYVKAGQKVEKGQVIGTMGSTGFSSDMHLHFEIWNNGKRDDPLDYYSGVMCRLEGRTGSKKDKSDYNDADYEECSHS